MPVTVTFSTMVAPPLRAPFARASVVSIGFVRPSRGIHTAPARSSVRISGQRRPASPGEITSTSTPEHFAIDAPKSEEHTSELQSRLHLVFRLLLLKKKKKHTPTSTHP